MSKRLRYILLICLALIISGYIIGQFIPFDLLSPTIVNKELTINEYYTRIISIVGTVVTLSAVVVALFKEDIRKIWDKATLEVTFKDSKAFHEILDSDIPGASTYRAKKYETSLIVRNNGSQAAKSCEIFLESLHFKSQNFPTHQEIQLSGNPLKWSNNSSSSILIPATGKAQVAVLEVLSSDSQVVTAGEASTATAQPKIRIGDTESPIAYTNGIWIAKFKIYSENAVPIEHKVQITWNSRWENRITEMNSCLQIQVIA